MIQLDDEPNLYIENGWKSPNIHLFQWLALGFHYWKTFQSFFPRLERGIVCIRDDGVERRRGDRWVTGELWISGRWVFSSLNKWLSPKKHLKLIMFSRKTHKFVGVSPTILGNPLYIDDLINVFIWIRIGIF